MGASMVDLNSQDSVVQASEPRESSRRGSAPRHAASSEYCEEEEDERKSRSGGPSRRRSASAAAPRDRRRGRPLAPSLPASGLSPPACGRDQSRF